MKRLFILTALVVAATVTTCTADTIGLFRAVAPLATPEFENKVLWLLFAPQPEPPKIANDGRTIQVRLPDTTSDRSLDVWVLVEGAAAPSWHLNGSARMGIEPSPFYLNVGQRLAGGGVSGASVFKALPTTALPPGAPAGPWIGGQFTVGCPVGSTCALANPNEVEIWVDTGGTTPGILQITAVPEPATLLLLGTGLLGLGARQKRRR